jgi:hypothetical protein
MWETVFHYNFLIVRITDDAFMSKLTPYIHLYVPMEKVCSFGNYSFLVSYFGLIIFTER